ncbi:MAG: hypothetical protein AB8G26_20055 [Ilumatobacter sp.]
MTRIASSSHRRRSAAICFAVAVIAAGCSSAPEPAAAPTPTVIDDDGDAAFTEIDVNDERIGGASSDLEDTVDETATADSSATPNNDVAAQPDGGSSDGDSDAASDSGGSSGSQSSDDESAPTPDVEDLTPQEIEDDEDVSIDDPDVRDAVEEAEEEFRNRPDAEPGEIDLANADITFETRYLGGRLTGATGSESVERGSIVAYSVVTDLDDILTLDGTELREPTRADSAQLVLRADTAGTFTFLLEDSGIALFEIVVS